MRLIDADILNNAIESDFDEVCVYDVEPNEAVMDFQRIVDEQPTAYDIDKVVEKLKERASQSCAVLFAAGIEEAISIIKAGEQDD